MLFIIEKKEHRKCSTHESTPANVIEILIVSEFRTNDGMLLLIECC